MPHPNFTRPQGQRRAYHEGMLLLRVRPTAPLSALAAGGDEAASLLRSPGLSALSTLERAGLIRQVTPVAPSSPDAITPLGLRSPLAAMAAAAAQAEPDPHQNAVLVELEPDVDLANVQLSLANDPNVEQVSRVPIRYLLAQRRRGTTATPAPVARLAAPPVSALWNLNKIQWAEARAHQSFQEPSNIRVAVLDTGIDPNHPDLQQQVESYRHAYPDLTAPSSDEDLIGHGSHVAGTIAARINNDVGINGICDCRLLIWKIFDDGEDFDPFFDEFGYFVNPIMYRRALADCVAQGVDVINLSIGGPGRPDFIERFLFNRLLANGTTVVAAMGNEREQGSPTSYPAAIPGVIAVGATSIDDKIASFSNRGNHISLSAPGVGIWSTLPTYAGQFGFANQGTRLRPVPGAPLSRETDYDVWDGTSMASPHVAAAAAVLLASQGTMSPAAVRDRLMATADKVPGMNGMALSS